jgi:hypothetical protein
MARRRHFLQDKDPLLTTKVMFLDREYLALAAI